MKEDSWGISLAYKSRENGVRDIIIPLIRFKLFRIESYRTYSELPSTYRRFKMVGLKNGRIFCGHWIYQFLVFVYGTEIDHWPPDNRGHRPAYQHFLKKSFTIDSVSWVYCLSFRVFRFPPPYPPGSGRWWPSRPKRFETKEKSLARIDSFSP